VHKSLEVIEYLVKANARRKTAVTHTGDTTGVCALCSAFVVWVYGRRN